MTREKIIEALAKIISAATLGKTSTRGGIDAATAVLELMRPKRLEWQRGPQSARTAQNTLLRRLTLTMGLVKFGTFTSTARRLES